MLLQPKQIFKQIILPVDQRGVIGTQAASVAQYSRRCVVVVSNRS